MRKVAFCLMFVTILASLIEAGNVQENLLNPTVSPSDFKENSKLTIYDEEKITDPDSRMYCTSTYTNQTDDYISEVYLLDSYTSGQDGPNSYGDYTSIVIGIGASPTYFLHVTFVSNGFTQHVWAWIDWNHDEVFDNSEDSNERYDLGEGIDTTLSTGFSVPEGAYPGTTRMRIIEQYNTDPGPCDPHENIYGETEDYTIDVNIEYNYWTGAVDNNWHNIDNWYYHLVPDATTHVSISNVTNKCWVHTGPAFCKSIFVEYGSGNDLRIYDEYLIVSENMFISGQLLMDHVEGRIIVNGDVTWGSGSRASIQANTIIDVYGSWDFYPGANVTINNGSVNMIGSAPISINSQAENCYFNNLNIIKSTSGYVSMGLISTDIIHIQGDLGIYDGVLDVLANSQLRIGGNLHIAYDACLTANSGSEIEIGGNWTNENYINTSTTGYYGLGELVLFNGSGDQLHSTNANEVHFSNLHINKSSGDFRPGSSIYVSGVFVMFNGDWQDQTYGFYHKFGGDIYIEPGGGFYPQETVTINGDSQSFQNYGDNLISNFFVDVTGTFTLNTDMILPDLRYLEIEEGSIDLNGNNLSAMDIWIKDGAELRVDEGARLIVIDGLFVDNGGSLDIAGVSGNRASVWKDSSWEYIMQVNSGGSISASYADFYYLGWNGVWVQDGAIVDPANCFNNCNFISGVNSSTSARLRIDNDQTLNISNINFNNNPYLASASNISKTVDQGEVYIISSAGDFAGEAYENDPYNRINWGLPEIDDLTIQHNLGSNEIELNWTYPIPVDHFKVYRSTDPYDFSGSTIFTTSTIGYSEPATGTKYFYQVTAENITDSGVSRKKRLTGNTDISEDAVK